MGAWVGDDDRWAAVDLDPKVPFLSPFLDSTTTNSRSIGEDLSFRRQMFRHPDSEGGYVLLMD